MKNYEPVGSRILIHWDKAKEKTKGGIVLPDRSRIKVTTGVIKKVSKEIREDYMEKWPFEEGQRILFDPYAGAIPADLEACFRPDSENDLWILDATAVYAIIHDDVTEDDIAKLFHGTDQLDEMEK